MKKSILILLIASLLIISVGCNNTGVETNKLSNENKEIQIEEDAKIQITDMAGREVEIEGEIEKIIVNQWDLAEVISMVVGEDIADMLLAVGGSGSAEGFQKVYGYKYPQLQNMEIIGGGGSNPYDKERILAINPDVFIVNSRGSFLEENMKDINDLEKAGVAVVVVTMGEDPIKSPQEAIELIGELFREESKAKEVNDFINKQFELVKGKNLDQIKDKPTVYYEHGRGDETEYGNTLTEGGWATIMDYAGGDNIAKGSTGNSKMIDPEYLISTDPDFIFVSTGLGYREQAFERAASVIDSYTRRRGWDNLKAVNNKNIMALFHDHARGPFAFYPTLYLAKNFYPEEFKDIDPDQILREFYGEFLLVDYDDGGWSYQID